MEFTIHQDTQIKLTAEDVNNAIILYLQQNISADTLVLGEIDPNNIRVHTEESGYITGGDVSIRRKVEVN